VVTVLPLADNKLWLRPLVGTLSRGHWFLVIGGNGKIREPVRIGATRHKRAPGPMKNTEMAGNCASLLEMRVGFLSRKASAQPHTSERSKTAASIRKMEILKSRERPDLASFGKIKATARLGRARSLRRPPLIWSKPMRMRAKQV